ncbi:type VII secretion protein EccCa [Mycolicibacterium mageritense]|uniref:type VII secretion protein EccCa n=1 Tax=Mycolicibacterium mageritense TaxID=53462 RepID=UPI001E5E3861|nr:type VII secretion protein EccCa [Mycolicibacterium mageritense]GJJ23808.1 type VII secretion protein EccC [Mycolicibacterium mageritense]
METTARTTALADPGQPGELMIDAPPTVPRAAPANVFTRLMPVVLAVAMVGMMAVYFSSGAAASRGPAFMFFPIMMVLSVIGTMVYSLRGNGRGAELSRDRREYLCYLDGLDAVLAAAAQAQWRDLHETHPAPHQLWRHAGSARMGERAPEHPAFCEVRIGVGERPSSTRLVTAEAATVGQPDPVTTGALRRLLADRATVSDVPVTVALREVSGLAIDGDASAARALLRAVVCQLATWHHPRDLLIAAVIGAAAADHWEWLKWLPHHGHPRRHDSAGPARMTYRSATEMHVDAPGAHVIVIVDSADPPAEAPGVTVLTVGARRDTAALLHIGDDGVRHGRVTARPDRLSESEALVCARRLARYASARSRRAVHPEWLDLVGARDVTRIDPPNCWRTSDPRRLLRVPIGRTETGTPVHLDLKEAAQDGMGPHGLCIGATGSGKSEFLRTLALGLVTTHSPDALNLVLVDFKGGATFLGLGTAPHVSALITNLADEAALVARMADALSGEITRRQELLRAAGGLTNITEYRRLCADLPALPALLIIVDEFSELLHQHPDFAELFVAIGRLGRSLGVHLLLASQRLDEGRLRGLETHLSYRICLKTFSPSESRAVLGIPDAYELPNTPGMAYLKTPAGAVTRFRTAFVSGSLSIPEPVEPTPTPGPFSARWSPPNKAVAQRDTTTLLTAVLGRLAGHGPSAHQVWLPPLPASVPLSDVLLAGNAPLCVAIGLVDCPFQQRRDRLVVTLAGAEGNVALVGGPQSGKSTTARTLALALAASHRPGDVTLYCLDFGGGALTALQALPHVGSVAGRHDGDLVRRTIAELEGLVRSREQRFHELGIDSMSEYRHSSDRDGYGDVFLIVDGWAALRQHHDTLEVAITALAAQGLSYGVHVVLTASRWAEFRPAVKDQLGTRIELRLGDPAESEMDRKRARQLGLCAPGRGLTSDGREYLIALPRLDGATSTTGGADALRAAADTLRTQYPGAAAPEIRLLPALVTRNAIGDVGQARPATQVVLGLGERELAPVVVDFGEQPDLVILGEAGCGKSTVLRTLCRELVATTAAADVQVLIVDFRRSLLGAVESDHLAGYAISTGMLEGLLPAAIDRLRDRIPGPAVTQRELRDRSWWSGPELYVVVDDYDLVAGTGSNPLMSLVEFLPHARDIGLHLVVARRSGGAARAMFDPVLARMKDLGWMGLMMSAGPEEGVLLGSVRPRPLPPGRGTLITRASAEQLIQVAVGPDP